MYLLPVADAVEVLVPLLYLCLMCWEVRVDEADVRLVEGHPDPDPAFVTGPQRASPHTANADVGDVLTQLLFDEYQ